MSIYAVGDVQGCYSPLRRLLDKCAFDPQYDQLWLVGDLVNRGPNSLDTLRYIKALGASARTVLGNHDLYLLMVSEGLRHRNTDDTLEQVLSAPDRDELLHWLRHQPLCYAEKGYGLVHAGLLPSWTLRQAQGLASEVERNLQGPHYATALAHFWGSEPAQWCDALSGWERLRVIVNAMTRMRFCSPTGTMEFHHKGRVNQAPKGYLPWFAIPHRQSTTDTLITGHWSALGLYIQPNLIALDSGYLWGGALTAIRLEDRKIFQITAQAS